MKISEIINEMDRRGFLRGAGAAAAGLALGNARADSLRPLTPGVSSAPSIDGELALQYKNQIYKYMRGQRPTVDGETIVVPAAHIGLRGGHSVDVVLVPPQPGESHGTYYKSRVSTPSTMKEDQSKYPYGRGIRRGDTVKRLRDGKTFTVTGVEGAQIVLDNGRVVTPRNEYIVCKRAGETNDSKTK